MTSTREERDPLTTTSSSRSRSSPRTTRVTEVTGWSSAPCTCSRAGSSPQRFARPSAEPRWPAASCAAHRL